LSTQEEEEKEEEKNGGIFQLIQTPHFKSSSLSSEMLLIV